MTRVAVGRVAVIGGGPMGMEAALYGACAGFDVRLYEHGRLAENVRQWGHVGLFTEWGRNRSPLACRLLREAGQRLAPDDTTSTGDELANYVLRLAALPPLRGRVHPQTEVAALTRERVLKSDFIADARRAEFPFRLVLRGAFGEKIAHAEAVIDATGVYATPNPAGSGGAPCPGEASCRARIDYHLPDVAGRDRKRFADRHTLVVGSGHSAASTLRAICDLIADHPQTRVTWIVRRDVPPHGFPYTLIPDDSSPHRDALHRRANELTQHPNVAFHPRTVVEGMARDSAGFRVTLGSAPPVAAGPAPQRAAALETMETLAVRCDNIAAHTGFRSDPSLWSELQVHEHPATGSPFALGEAIIAQNRRSGVGLSTGYAEKRPAAESSTATAAADQRRAEPAAPAAGEDALEDTPPVDKFRPVVGDASLLVHPEPYFYVIGIKSYGRDAGFLMQNGFRQVRDVYKLISGDAALDLYNGALD